MPFALVFIIAWLIFQTGRISIKDTKNLQELLDRKRAEGCRPLSQPADAVNEEQDDVEEKTCMKTLLAYASILLFLFFDGGRELTNMEGLQHWMGSVQTTVLMTSVAQTCIGLASAFIPEKGEKDRKSNGEILRLLFSPLRILRSTAPALCFAISGTCSSLAYSFDISAATKVALSNEYSLVSALLLRWVWRKNYSWLEWHGLAALSLAPVAFAMLQSQLAPPGQTTSVAGVSCVACSVLFGSLAGLLMEFVLKREKLPFKIQSFHLGIGQMLSGGILLFLLPFTVDHRAEARIWVRRPLTSDINNKYNKLCVKTTLGCDDPACEASYEECDAGFFVAWNWLIWAIVAASVGQAWFAGSVSKNFSSVTKNVVQCMTMITTYVAGHYLQASTVSLGLTTAVLLIPNASLLFIQSVQEMEKVTDIREEILALHSVNPSARP